MKFFLLLLIFILVNQQVYSAKPESLYDTQWMLDEHTKITLDVLNEYLFVDTLKRDTTFINGANAVALTYPKTYWNNSEAKIIVLSSNIYTDIEDKGTLLTRNLFSGIRFTETFISHLNSIYINPKTGKYIPAILNQLRGYEEIYDLASNSCGFNTYVNDLSDDGLSCSKGFHFDNLFSYSHIIGRWDTINNWINSRIKSLAASDQIETDFKKFLVILGMFLHAVQDFYCHSNWVILTTYYGKKDDSGKQDKNINAEEIPTWEEITNSVWLSKHVNFDTAAVFKRFRISDSIYSETEFEIDSPKGGLQTGNCKNFFSDQGNCEFMDCANFKIPQKTDTTELIEPWGHRHPGSWNKIDSNRRNSINKVFYAGACTQEHTAALELAKRASRYWINNLINARNFSKTKWKIISDYLMKYRIKVENMATGCDLNIHYLLRQFSDSYK